MHLRDWLSARNIRQADFAAAMTVAGTPMTQSRVSQIVKGGTNALVTALAIEQFTGGAVTVADLKPTETARTGEAA